MTKKRSFH